MTWADKQLKKHRARKQVEEILNSPEFKKYEQERDLQAVLDALGSFTFMACGYLEIKHGYKKEGLKKFLSYMRGCIESMDKDEEFLIATEKYFKEEVKLDVLKELGLTLNK